MSRDHLEMTAQLCRQEFGTRWPWPVLALCSTVYGSHLRVFSTQHCNYIKFYTKTEFSSTSCKRLGLLQVSFSLVQTPCLGGATRSQLCQLSRANSIGILLYSQMLPSLRSWNHKTVWIERDLKDNQFPTPCHGQGCHPPAQAAQGCIQLDLKHLQEWAIHSFSGQSVQGPHHPE